jgi:hypothetical protein
MKPSGLRIERLLAKVEAELACSARARRYVFHPDEVAEAEAQGFALRARTQGFEPPGMDGAVCKAMMLRIVQLPISPERAPSLREL